jgi:predicted CopG family antitoxin
MKSVSFQDAGKLCTVLCHVASRSAISKSDVRKTWYNEEDYEYFQIERNYCSTKLRKASQDTILNRILPCDEEETADLTRMQSILLVWTQIEICRGLETRINLAHGNQRAREKRRAIFAILRMQALLKDHTEDEEFSEKVRELSEKNTENARVFAYAIGLADEETVKLELQHPPSTSRRITIFNRIGMRRDASRTSAGGADH